MDNKFQLKELMRYIYHYRLNDENVVKKTGELINNIFKNFYSRLIEYNPDINGYTLFFLVPPHLSSPEYEKILGTPDYNTSFFKFLNSISIF